MHRSPASFLPRYFAHALLIVFVSLGLPACGDDRNSNRLRLVDTAWEPGNFAPANTYAARCRTPRAIGDRAGSSLHERHFLRSWSHETYLWYDEIEERNPGSYDTIEYFNLLKTAVTIPSGRPKDDFHHHMPTDEWNALSQSGLSLGYGITWAMTSSRPPRELLVAYVEPNSPADLEGVERGDRVLTVDGVDLAESNNVRVLNQGLWPEDEDETHQFVFESRRTGLQKTVALRSGSITTTPVLTATTLPNTNVGYLLFNDHIATAEKGLFDAFTDLQGVDDLILDIRYNGGGYLAIASQLAYMIAGDGPTQNQPFESTRFNDKHPDINPVTGNVLRPIPFYTEGQGFSVPVSQTLPTLDLPRVFVLTGSGTCSASEAIINGLRGVDVEVIQIGSTTCGKPYGYYPQNNCGVTYFSIQFQGVNAKGFGDYADGFSPDDELDAAGPRLPGCAVGDDFTHELGDPAEGRLAAALAYMSSNGASCGLGASNFAMHSKTVPSSLSAVDAQVIKPAALQGRVMDR